MQEIENKNDKFVHSNVSCECKKQRTLYVHMQKRPRKPPAFELRPHLEAAIGPHPCFLKASLDACCFHLEIFQFTQLLEWQSTVMGLVERFASLPLKYVLIIVAIVKFGLIVCLCCSDYCTSADPEPVPQLFEFLLKEHSYFRHLTLNMHHKVIGFYLVLAL